MAVISTTSRFAVDEVSWVAWVGNALDERSSGSCCGDNCEDGSEGEECVGELHVLDWLDS